MNNRKEIVYIAGPMRGLPDLGRARFMQAEEKLKESGYIVLNPARLPVGMPDDHYMPICLAMLAQADALCLLEGWTHSQGAQIEKDFANMQGKRIFTLIMLEKEEG